jgi:hypothetical protein
VIDPVARLQSLSRFRVRQRAGGTLNRYEIRSWEDDGPGDLLAQTERRRMAAKEQVTFYADEAGTTPVFGFKARAVLDVHGLTDVVDAHGVPIGTFGKDQSSSLLRATWRLEQSGRPPAHGIERNLPVALVRRLFLEFLPYHFDFLLPDHSPVMSIDKTFTFLRDAYDVEIHDPDVDRRMAAAVAVAVDAFKSR